jgi:hypothetical protein
LLTIFNGGLTNRPEHTMFGKLASSGRVEITLFAGKSCVVLVGELKHDVHGDDSSVLAQIMVEAEGTSLSLSATNLVRG